MGSLFQATCVGYDLDTKMYEILHGILNYQCKQRLVDVVDETL